MCVHFIDMEAVVNKFSKIPRDWAWRSKQRVLSRGFYAMLHHIQKTRYVCILSKNDIDPQRTMNLHSIDVTVISYQQWNSLQNPPLFLAVHPCNEPLEASRNKADPSQLPTPKIPHRTRIPAAVPPKYHCPSIQLHPLQTLYEFLPLG